MPSNAIDLDALLRETRAAAIKAGEIMFSDNERPRRVKFKGRIDLVTETDLAVEQFLKQKLENLLPEATFLAEESASGEELSNLTWVIDPLDGTTNFAHGLPFVATSIGLWQEGRMVLAVINCPFLNECFSARLGGGVFCNDTAIGVSDAASPESSLVATGFPYVFEGRHELLMARLNRTLPLVQGVRRCGAAAIDLAFVAAGRFDAYYEGWLAPWDVAAGWLLVEEAGGRVSDLSGAPYHLRSQHILATNGRVHGAFVNLLGDLV